MWLKTNSIIKKETSTCWMQMQQTVTNWSQLCILAFLWFNMLQKFLLFIIINKIITKYLSSKVCKPNTNVISWTDSITLISHISFFVCQSNAATWPLRPAMSRFLQVQDTLKVKNHSITKLKNNYWNNFNIGHSSRTTIKILLFKFWVECNLLIGFCK